MRRTRTAATVLCCLAMQPSAWAADTIRFDTQGGDAWTFDKRVTGRIAANACDEVLIRNGNVRVQAEISGERFLARVPLRFGENRLRATCRRANRERERSPPQIWQVQLPDRPKAKIRARIEGGELVLDARGSELARGSPAELSSMQWRLARARSQQSIGSTPVVRVAVPKANGEYRIELNVSDTRGRSDRAAALLEIRDSQARVLDPAHDSPPWLDTAVIYGVVPFLFGGFAGVHHRLDEIAALGATAIWLSPVTATASDDFGYAPVDHLRLRDTFGGDREFRALIDAAHALGLKVILDFVPNHFSTEHRYSLDAAQLGERSAYFDWFDRNAQGAVTHYFDWQHLNNLNLDHREVRNYLLAAFTHWLREYDVDGFRVDAAWAITQRAPDFWREWRVEMKRIKPDALLLAEAAPADAKDFDASYDWTPQIGEWSWRDIFHDPHTVPDLDRLRAVMADTAGAPRLRFTDNNDTGERFITRYGEQYARLGAALTFTLPGIPLIYNGDEIGAAFEPYDEGPLLQWQDPRKLSTHYRRLAQLRQQYGALRSRELRVLETNKDERVLAFVRPMPRCEDEVLVAFNFSARASSTVVRLGARARQWRDVSAAETFPARDQHVRLTLDPYSWRVLQAEQCRAEH